MDHDAKGWDGIAESGDLVVEVGAVALLDHVMCGLLGRRAVAAGSGRRRGRRARRRASRARGLALARRISAVGILGGDAIERRRHRRWHHAGLEMRRLRRDGRNGSLEKGLSVDVVETDSAKGDGIRNST